MQRIQKAKGRGLLVLAAAAALSVAAGVDAMGQGRGLSQAAGSGGAGRPTQYPGGVWEPGPAKYGAVVVDDVPVKMDDGVVLRASVAFPTDPATGKRAAGPFPVIVEHTPYTRLAQPVTPNTYLTEHGYIYALVRARGAGASGGELQMFSSRDGMDGKAIVDWAAHHLDGSDGRIGLLGCSWPGAIALDDAAFVGPNSPVKAVVAACVGLEHVQRYAWLVGGVPSTGFWNFTARGAGLMGDSPAAARYFSRMASEVSAGGDVAYDGAFWQDRLPLGAAQKIVDNGLPVLLWAGWGDILESGTVRAFTALQNAYQKRPLYAPMTADEPVTPRYQVIIGNWGHAGGLDAGIYLQWMDTWLKGVDTGIQRTNTPMHLFEPGTDRWINAARYPLVDRYTPWRLAGNGALTPDAPTGEGQDSLTFGDPAQAGSSLAFTTPSLAHGMTLAGPISATLYVKSSNTNLELIAHLYDVAPDGTTTLVSRGVVLGSQRALDPDKSWTDGNGVVTWPWPTLKRDDYLKPGQVYRLELALAPRQWAINPNHRLRLELVTQNPSDMCSSTGLPPENGVDPCRGTAPQRATLPGGVYAILHGPQWPSALNLPQLPWKAFPATRSGIPPTPWNEGERRLGDTARGDRAYTLPLDWGSGP